MVFHKQGAYVVSEKKNKKQNKQASKVWWLKQKFFQWHSSKILLYTHFFFNAKGITGIFF